MSVIIPGQERLRSAVTRPRQYGPGAPRKIGIIGTYKGTLGFAPWADPTWEFWSHASAFNAVPAERADMLIDIHPPHCHQEKRKNGFIDYYDWLKKQRTPVMMQKRYPEVVSSQKYPYEEIKSEFPGIEIGSQVSYMIALALVRGVTHIGLWGVQFSSDSEYKHQRGNCQLWIGIAIGRGVQLVIPRGCTLLSDIGEDYGFQTHATPEKWDQWKQLIYGHIKKRVEAIPAPETFLQRLKPMNEPADFATAQARRIEHDPEWVKGTNTMDSEEAADHTIASEG